MEQRGIAVTTSSAALVTLLFGLSNIASGTQLLELRGYAKVPTIISLVFFLFAAALGLWINSTLLAREWRRPSPTEHDRIEGKDEVDEDSELPASKAAVKQAEMLLRRRDFAHGLNRERELLLSIAIVFEVVAVTLLVVSLTVVLSASANPQTANANQTLSVKAQVRPNPVASNSSTTLYATSEPDASCIAAVAYSSAPPPAFDGSAKEVGSGGVVSWPLQVVSKATSGTAIVTCSLQGKTTSVTTIFDIKR